MRTSMILSVILLALLASACGGTDGTSGETSNALTQSTTANGVQVTLTTSGPLVQGVPNTYTWTATNLSTRTLTVSMGSNWTDADGGAPIIKALAPGCGNQSQNDIPANDALGIWCGSATLAPGASFSVWATLQDDAVGPVRYNVYSVYVDAGLPFFTVVADTESAGPGPVDLQISGSSSQGSPPIDGTYTYTYLVKNAGPWATSGGVSFSDALPASLAFVGVTTSAGTCTGGQAVSCALGDLANGAQATVAITVKAPSTAQSIVNTASASLTAPQSDTNAGNNSVTITVASK